MGRREAVLLLVASAAHGCVAATADPPSAAPTPAVSAPAAAAPGAPASPIAERVAKAFVRVEEEGTHWHRTDALVALGAEAVPELRTVVLDRAHGTETRVFAARALGRIGGRDAAAALHDLLADKAAPAELRNAS